jgi:SAM-dependent methyltransferase
VGSEAVILDEAAFSDITDPALKQEVRDAAYHGVDIRPAWIGARRPRTEIDGLKDIAHWASVHYDYYLNFVRDHVNKIGDVLDIGCGAGQATAMLARYAGRSVGIDSDENVIEFARKHNTGSGATFIHGAFPSKALNDRHFDYIFCVETMEHLPYDQQQYFLTRALGLLHPDGRMFITTPNEPSASPPHIGIWTKEWVGHMTQHLGPRIEARGYFSNTQPVGMQQEPASHHAWVLR